ncbi:hypothetical protein TCAL_13535 [Tigriopus californicus]|uniref:RecA family profile 1 domain-containing protein n=1 Tax=Tigriopus californicus TaxID=6832 RepID=A0A553N8B0_TIGCA|nr:uncharacterized protein LOC131885900 [Tigriopus californicus]TRY61658.1 hypothetical protein TCAL_13535 [Tigriopus californicus]|eukprot:TCALIF_13535-PA protein Name:"Similar to RAD51D DNA repair protein RAD51 homolog 4 (Arabidopsis thaliana)" AED:0.38 eAED:0.38 QI:0/-1/0/1/-1/1/1/0/257
MGSWTPAICNASQVIFAPQIVMPINVASFDAILGGGFHFSQVYELYGRSGVGKTQLALTLATQAILSERENCNVVYLDSECDFRVERLAEIIQSQKEWSGRCYNRAVLYHEAFRYKKLFSLIELQSVLENIVRAERAEIGVLIIDSIAPLVLPLMAKSRNLGEIFGLVGIIGGLLRKIAIQHTACVLVLNHTTWKTQTRCHHPSLGRMFSNCASVRLYMDKQSDESTNCFRTITLDKGACRDLNRKCIVRLNDEGLS